ncbi:hypothetical protein K503DRAFT_522580 [Rhizopogon vinicolor AM-OR11-026]|uniref:Uncharacterized protein n=1 Tax=Rhizopogon vinicolor AM-OR11-026 TaxID=1314800 RepID=A0A1B7MLK7_9AGAM|nr:hypothetical protein K503DRAFT_522580 [Rhizopogon vinicolor AM-OR11-026]
MTRLSFLLGNWLRGPRIRNGGRGVFFSLLSGPGMDLFSDTASVAFQQIVQSLFSPFRLGAYIHENQQLQALRDHCKALEMQIVKITTERDTIFYVIIFCIDFVLISYQIEFPATCKCCTPSRPAAPSESDLSVVLCQIPVLGSPPAASYILCDGFRISSLFATCDEKTMLYFAMRWHTNFV